MHLIEINVHSLMIVYPQTIFRCLFLFLMRCRNAPRRPQNEGGRDNVTGSHARILLYGRGYAPPLVQRLAHDSRLVPNTM